MTGTHAKVIPSTSQKVGSRVAMLVVLAAATEPVWADENPLTGAQIYRQMCARCHGAEGEGVKKEYPQPLAGKRSLEQLTRYIAKSMPEDDPGKLKGPDATKVAAYVFDNFYSPAAQARRKPARVELSRLTIRQYRNAVADLIASFRPGQPPLPESGGAGLRGEYFKGRLRGSPKGLPVIARIDPVIQIDLGSSSPDARELDSNEFSVRWEGSLLAPDTGEYEFVIRTDQSARLWLNDNKKPFVDASVKSGNDTEYRASIYLLAGRPYPLRLEFFRSTLGVQKKDKVKEAPVKASLALEWKRPGRTRELIAQRFLFPTPAVPTLVVPTPFPADDRSAGYERGASVSKAWVDASTEAALLIAGYVADHLSELAGAAANAADRVQRLRTFALTFAERAFRRPLTAEQKRLYIDRQFDAAPDADTAVKRVVLLVLESPWFLYRELDAGLADKAGAAFDTACRLSFGLWDSLPDEELHKAAANGQLETRAQIAAQAQRMLKDPRCRAKIDAFFLLWLKVEQAADLSKDSQLYAGFDRAAASDLRTSLELFLDATIWSPASDFRQLLLADDVYLNGRLAQFYGAALPPSAPFQKVAFKPDERCGVLTHPYVMATFAYPKDSSPIHRGVFLARGVLGLPLRPPADAFTPLPAELHPGLTNRERVALQTTPQACQSCHAIINPLGFTLERYDAIGRYRDKDKGRPIDATGAYQTRDGQLVRFSGVRDLAQFLANSSEVHEAFIAQFFHHLVRQPISAYGTNKLAELRDYFTEHDCNVRMLAQEIIVRAACHRPL
jgi:mono/diheme cytochrome c family protein